MKRFHLEDGVIAAGAWLVHEQVGFGGCAVREIRMGALVDLAVEPVGAGGRPAQAQLVVKLVAVDALAIDGITAMDRQMKLLRRHGRSICQKAGKLVHDALAYESVISS